GGGNAGTCSFRGSGGTGRPRPMGAATRDKGEPKLVSNSAAPSSPDPAHATQSRSLPAASLLMCEPAHFGVTYSINPWMDPASWARDDRALAATARREWMSFNRVLTRLGAAIELVPAAPGLPDLVFTANAALVLD